VNTFAIKSPLIVTPHGTRAGFVLVRDGVIAGVLNEVPADVLVIDTPHAVLPGAVDVHVHCNEPGRTEWEGFETATRAAAAGGITTIVDMPLNSSPVTTTLAALREKIAATQSKLHVDVGFHGGLVPGNETRLDELIEAGVLGVKAFLCHSGIDEFPNATERELRIAMPTLAAHSVPLLAHAELVGDAPRQTDVRSYRQYLASRPRAWENAAVRLLVDLCRKTDCPTHIVHLSSSDVLEELAAARSEGLPLTVETCPHYLFFSAEEIRDGDTRFKCAPPIREAENREKLWAALRDGTIDTIASDHSPCEPSLKLLDQGDFTRAWGGISSLQLGWSIIWTGASQRGFTLNDLALWMATRPARLVALDGRKGAIQAGYDADLVIFDPDADFVVDASKLHHRHKVTPYDGVQLKGRVIETYLRGRRIDGQRAQGQIVLRPKEREVE